MKALESFSMEGNNSETYISDLKCDSVQIMSLQLDDLKAIGFVHSNWFNNYS